MIWQYRVVRRTIGPNTYSYGIYQAYYKEDGTCLALSDDTVGAYGDSRSELVADYTLLGDAFKLPTLDYDTCAEIKE